MSAPRPWAASDEGVRLHDAKDNLVAVMTPDEARALGQELIDVASYTEE